RRHWRWDVRAGSHRSAPRLRHFLLEIANGNGRVSGVNGSGMQPIGRFGIGFFSVFILGSVVRGYLPRWDRGQDTARLLEFRGGLSSRPILSPAGSDTASIDGGTRVEVLLKSDPRGPSGLLWVGHHHQRSLQLARVVGAVAPNLEVSLFV